MNLSIIIPVFNVAPYLKECFDSILSIDFCDYEIIVVEDCSTDNPYAILDWYKKEYENFKIVYHDENLGSSVARNTGIKTAIGDYLYFLDGDDYIIPKKFRQFYFSTIKDNLDMAISENLTKDMDGRIFNPYNIPFSKTPIMNGRSLFVKLMKLNTVPPGIQQGNLLYKREFIISNSLLFLEGAYAQDNYFFIQTIFTALKVKYTSCQHMIYRIREGSVYRNRNLYHAKIQSVLRIISHLEEIYSNCTNDAILKKSLRTFICHKITGLFYAVNLTTIKNWNYKLKRVSVLHMIDTYNSLHKLYFLPLIISPRVGLLFLSSLYKIIKK